MSIAKRLVTVVAAILMVASIVCAQEQNAATGSRSTTTVTAAATSDRVRFTAPSTVVQMRLEVYAANGEKLFDNEVRGGNVIDWHLQDGQAERVSDGSYLCVITSKGLSGRMSQKLGKITIENAAASVQPMDITQLTAQQTQAVGPLEENASLTLLREGETQTATIIAHNGEEGQLVRGRGALSFRIGDFYSGKDTEQMRLTPEGNLGIGITHPKVRLDVDGLIRTNQGVVFPDGTIQTTAAASVSGGEVAPGDIGAGAGKLFKETNQGASSAKDGKGKKKVSPEFNVNEDLTINGNIIFTPSLARDITMQQNIGGIRIFAGTTLTALAPTSAAIQFFGNGHAGFPGQAYIDSGANDAAAVIFRTTGTGGTITERMRVTATGNVGIGTPAPGSLLDVAGNIHSNINTSAQYNIGSFRVLIAGNDSISAGTLSGGVSGPRNSFFGGDAGLFNNSSGFNNAFFGFAAGQSNTDGHGNTIIGAFANTSGASLTNATAIGTNASVSQSDSLVLGNGVNVGIGTSAPQYKLHVVGQDVRVESSAFPRFSLNFTGGAVDEKRWQNYASTSGLNFSALNDADNAETFWLQVHRGTGTAISSVVFPGGFNVGIGTNTPNAKLHVVGGSIYIAQPNSLVITSPNGNCWFITVSDMGVLSSFLVTCP